MAFRTSPLALAACLPLLLAAPLAAQSPPEPAGDPAVDDAAAFEVGDEPEITVTGQKPRGAALSDIAPEQSFDPRDIRATGASSVEELLSALAPQLGSVRGRGGGRPLMLLNGRRISGFRELRDLPPEAIERMDILPEEVALAYGQPADQRVVNIVLRRRFHSTSGELRGLAATGGGTAGGEVTVGRLAIAEGRRRSLNLKAETRGALDEDERPLAGADPARTLVGTRDSLRLTGTHETSVAAVPLVLAPELEWDRSVDGLGLSGVPGIALGRETQGVAARLGLSASGARAGWQIALTGDTEIARRESDGPDRAPPGGGTGQAPDRSTVQRLSANLLATASGPIAQLPAGAARLTVKAGGSALASEASARRAGIEQGSDLARRIGTIGASLDLPLAKRGSRLGRLSANLNAGIERLSDFGTLASVGGGLHWAPAPRLTVVASWTREEGAPTLAQLGDPLVETAGVPFFDARSGQAERVTTISGGNPALAADRRRVAKLGVNWQPLADKDWRLRADFARERIEAPQISVPAASPGLEAAFPDRFTRDAQGRLVRVDLRPVSGERAERSSLRLGFDFSRRLKSKPPSAETLQRLRARAGASGERREGDAAGRAPRDAAAAVERGGFRGRGGGNGGRVQFSLTDTLTFVDRLTIAPGLPALDYRGGEARGSGGGRPLHAIEAQAGYSNNGLGGRLSLNWRSATGTGQAASATASPAAPLRFAPYGTLDLRLFVQAGQRLDWVARHPALRGTSLRIDVTNVFDSRPRVTGAGGTVPLAYDPYRLEPTGRTISLALRKLFVPRRFFRPPPGERQERRGAER